MILHEHPIPFKQQNFTCIGSGIVIWKQQQQQQQQKSKKKRL